MREKFKNVSLYINFFITTVFAVFSAAFFISAIKLGCFINSERLSEIICRAFTCILIVSVCVCAVLKTSERIIIGRLFSFLILLLFIICGLAFLFVKSGLADKIDSVESLRVFISSFGGYSAALYIIVQFLQVAVFPIPSFITVGAGVLLFGPLKAAILSVFGIISGSVFAFIIGRKFGVKAVIWLIGKNNLEKGLNFIEGKGEILLTFMFLFPFFPDDVLCFAAGLTKVKSSFFIIMISVVRTITVFISCFSINNSLIPYNTWWGVLIWVLIFVLTVFTAIIIYKKSEKIKTGIKERKNK